MPELQKQEILVSSKQKQTRSHKLTKDQSDNNLKKIFQELRNHVGGYAILFVKNGREMVPYFVKLILIKNSIVAKYKCYSPDGEFRGCLSHIPDCISLLIGEQKIIYLDEI